MADDAAPVGGQAHVEFETIAAVSEREFEGSGGVLGSVAAGAAMAEQERFGH